MPSIKCSYVQSLVLVLLFPERRHLPEEMDVRGVPTFHRPIAIAVLLAVFVSYCRMGISLLVVLGVFLVLTFFLLLLIILRRCWRSWNRLIYWRRWRYSWWLIETSNGDRALYELGRSRLTHPWPTRNKHHGGHEYWSCLSIWRRRCWWFRYVLNSTVNTPVSWSSRHVQVGRSGLEIDRS